MKADLGAVRLSGCHCRRGTRAGIPSPREGDRFGERAAGGLRGEGFGKGKVEGTESKEVPGEQRRVRTARRRQRERSREPERGGKRETRGRKARERRARLGIPAGRGCKKDGQSN